MREHAEQAAATTTPEQQTSTPEGGGGPMAAAEAAIRRMLHLDPVHQLAGLISAYDGIDNEHATPERAYVQNKAQQHHVRGFKPKDQRAIDVIKKLVELIQKTSDTDLMPAVRGLTAARVATLDGMLGYGAAGHGAPKEAGRCFLALSPSQRAGKNLSMGAVPLTWGLTPQEMMMAQAACDSLPIGERLKWFQQQPLALRQKIKLRTTADELNGAAVDQQSLFVGQILYGGTATFDADAVEARLAMVDGAIRTEILSSALALKLDTDDNAAFALAYLLISDPTTQLGRRHAVVEACAAHPGALNIFAPTNAPRLMALLAGLPKPLRARLDDALLAHNSPLAKAMGVKPKPTTREQNAAAQAAAMRQMEEYERQRRVFKDATEVRAPVIHEDHGFLDDGHGNIDPKKHRAPTLGDRAAKLAWEARVLAAERIKPELVDATRAYRHFLDASGTDLVFSYEKFVKDDASGRHVLASAEKDLRASAIDRSNRDGRKAEHFLLQTGVIGVGAHDGYPYPATENWQKAIGAHEIWLEASVDVTLVGGKRHFEIAMTLHAQDRYNFNPGAADVASETPDDDNGRFEVTGLGKEFLSKSTLHRDIAFDEP